MLHKIYVLLLAAMHCREKAARFLGVRIGRECRIITDPKNFGSEPWLVSIGNHVTIGSGVVFLTHDGATWLVRDEKGRRFRYARIEVADEVFIGVNAVIMPGVRIGPQCIIGAGNVVTKSVPSGYVVGGNPARILCSFAEYREKALCTFVSEAEMLSGDFRTRVERVVEPGAKVEMSCD